MRARLAGLALVLCALPASGEDEELPPEVVRTLTSFDSQPTRSAINNLFSSPIDGLRALALDRTIDLGIELRAIRALPAYCSQQTCGAGSVVHDTLVQLIDNSPLRPMQSAAPLSPAMAVEHLRLRAAVEALGALRSKEGGDVQRLLPLLAHRSRDIRTTVVRALRNLCSQDAIEPLRSHYALEPTDQVKHATAEALRELRTCH